MEKEFVDYQTALALKELGFDEECFAWYHPNMYLVYSITKDKDSIVNVPLYSQAFRFFREKYRLDANIYECVKINDKDTYSFKLVGIKNYNFFYGIGESWNTYEESELECIKKLIEIGQQKK